MAHCRNPILYKILLAKCPAKCGLCDKPGALGKCPDAHDSCPVIARFPDACNNERIQKILADSTSTIAVTRPACADQRTNCEKYAPFCRHERYSAVLSTICPRTCGLCVRR
ncbi:unnamed protein product [Dracunculus medinensis]|uniref:ShKT domain-containing protein n=1 Tax=Dracunculus medinensis TaxID=318479 RepID=A0A0N4US30_DRAME|nr:unnamed protein product [Dracunculus medinensis]